MESSFALKDGRTARIEIWNVSQLEKYVEEHVPDYPHRPRSVEGFIYFCPDSIQRLLDPPRYEYEKYEHATFRSPLEQQPEPRMPRQAYHRAVVALRDQEVIGIILCKWVSYNNYWRYSLNYIDVHKDHKNKGVGTHLMRALDQAPFLKGKIIQRTLQSGEGKKWISHVVERELHTRDYALLPYFYDPVFGPPMEPGLYNGEGKRIERIERAETTVQPTTSLQHPSPSLV